ncbi:MAG: hypothetical protein D6753_02325 [Planctomycetota bacterium]|nr:MAG: hypothetical protein D6753_02325 [Planctomycetota bacterium]
MNYRLAVERCFVNRIEFVRLFWGVVGLSMLMSALHGQDEPPEFLHGVVGHYQFADTAFEKVDDAPWFSSRADARDPRLQGAGPGRVRWTGLLHVRDKGPIVLHVWGAGEFAVRVDGKTVASGSSEAPQWHVSAPLEQRFGRLPLEIDFTVVNPAGSVFRLFWSGPGFELEPIAPRYFWHEYEETVVDAYTQGSRLVRALRCAACHQIGPSTRRPLAAPALTRLRGNIRPEWIVEALIAAGPPGAGDGSATGEAVSGTRQAGAENDQSMQSDRRMPFFGLSQADARAVVAALLAASEDSEEPPSPIREIERINARKGRKDPALRMRPDADAGRRIFHSIGCVACHNAPALGEGSDLHSRSPFSGGTLTQVAAKRTSAFFDRWLVDPASVNRDHRMTVFELTAMQRMDLAAYLTTLGTRNPVDDVSVAESHSAVSPASAAQIARGEILIGQLRCAACHHLPERLNERPPSLPLPSIAQPRRTGCLEAPSASPAAQVRHPWYALERTQIESVAHFIARAATGDSAQWHRSGASLVEELNCLECHDRNLSAGISRHLPEIATVLPELADRLPAMSPPPLTGIGDKLTNDALRTAIARSAPAVRPWMDIQMPKYRWDEATLQQLVNWLVDEDRIPPRDTPAVALPEGRAAELAAARLVTSEGFGCQSCHQIGDMDPPQVDLKARGTNLSMIGRRVRPSWFQRWVRNPARIVPRMEMPAIQQPVRGVLDDDLDLQLAALWKVLNEPGFQPPRPNPIRVVRTHNLPDLPEEPQLVACVMEAGQEKYVWPLAIGLPNRNNMLFDLETGQLQYWWIGDLARQHTRGKSWYWEPGNSFLNTDALQRYSLETADGRVWTPAPDGQVVVHLDAFGRRGQEFYWQGRIHFRSGDQQLTVPIEQTYAPLPRGENGVRVETSVDAPAGMRVRVDAGAVLQSLARGVVVAVADDAVGTLQATEGIAAEVQQGLLRLGPAGGGQPIGWTSIYTSSLPPETFPWIQPPEQEVAPTLLDVVPGYRAVQLPLPRTEMPISFAWNPRGEMFMGSLKGRVFRLQDEDGDGLWDGYQPISDNIPTPYGLWADENAIDVLAKFALLRMRPAPPAELWDARVVADGWGYTSDYHDWAVGLERDADGNYYIALPCQQDDRRPEQAYLRGHALKLVPRFASADAHRLYRIESIAAGLRFPMGLVLTRSGDLFATDNQGNYNPFNELNHLRPGLRYGFINKLENKPGFAPPEEPPAINLPHPWTRSVNGVCQLVDPQHPDDPAASRFGPFEGHLIGCEMNGRALIRMSLQRVGDTYQGAAYLFSRQPDGDEPTFEGPIVCEVAPDGDLYVGNLHDSGWGGGANTGSIVRLTPAGPLPVGIAEVTATRNGFQILFTQPLDRGAAAHSSAYQIRSYRRISTPAYGGDDQDERTEMVDGVEVADDGRRVLLQLPGWRPGFVYEINIGPIGSGGTELFPSQAHYTLRTVPE